MPTPNDDRDIAARLKALPRHEIPTPLLAKIKLDLLQPSLWSRLSMWMFQPAVLKPVGAFAIAAAMISTWFFNHRSKADELEFVDLEPLLAAHARYENENLIPSADMFSSNTSGNIVLAVDRND